MPETQAKRVLDTDWETRNRAGRVAQSRVIAKGYRALARRLGNLTQHARKSAPDA